MKKPLSSLRHHYRKFRRSKYFRKKTFIATCCVLVFWIIVAVSFTILFRDADHINAPKQVSIWPELLQRYQYDDSTNQLLFIKCIGKSSNATANYFIKSDKGDSWDLVAKGDAFIGKNGLGKNREGDKKTPEGDFLALKAFGIKPDPGTCFDYLNITSTTVACDEDCQYYNQIIDINKTGFYNGEVMSSYAPQYHYGFTIDFNTENIYPNGSNIFLHCKGAARHTAGCVAIDESMMIQILTTATPGFKICIHSTGDE